MFGHNPPIELKWLFLPPDIEEAESRVLAVRDRLVDMGVEAVGVDEAHYAESEECVPWGRKLSFHLRAAVSITQEELREISRFLNSAVEAIIEFRLHPVASRTTGVKWWYEPSAA